MDETDERFSLNVDYVHGEHLLPRGDSCDLPMNALHKTGVIASLCL